MTQSYPIVGLTGSLRRASLNKTLLKNDDGRLTDFATLQVLQQLMDKFVHKVECSKE